MINALEDSRMYKFDTSTGTSSYGYVKQRLIKQRIDSLQVYQKRFQYEDDLINATDEFSKWWVIFSEVMSNQLLADKYQRLLCLHITNTISSLEKIQIKVFK
jgi:uncharacterized protein YqeY